MVEHFGEQLEDTTLKPQDDYAVRATLPALNGGACRAPGQHGPFYVLKPAQVMNTRINHAIRPSPATPAAHSITSHPTRLSHGRRA